MERSNTASRASRFAHPAAAVLCLAALVGSLPARAADLVTEEPAPPAAPMEEPPVASWAGTYAGVQLGYGFAGRTRTDDNRTKTDGFVGGGFAGLQGQSEAFVYGGEADIGYSGLHGEDDGLKSKGGVEGSLRARLGYSVTPDLLLYGTGGAAMQKLEVTQGGGEDDRGMVGYTVGAGTDFKITQNVFGRVEYRYTDFGSKDFELGSGRQSVDSSNHRILFGVGLGF